MIVMDLNTFNGIDNVSSDLRFVGKTAFLKSATNVYVTNSGTLKTRPNLQKIYDGNSISNLWRDKDGSIYFSDGSAIKRLYKGVIDTVGYASSHRLSFVRCGDLIFVSDYREIKCISGEFDTDVLDSKLINPHLRLIPAGTLLYLKGRLFSIIDSEIYYSEPYFYLFHDPSNFIMLPSTVIGACSTNDYICISTNMDIRAIFMDMPSTPPKDDYISSPNMRMNILMQGELAYALIPVSNFIVNKNLIRDAVIIHTRSGFYVTDGSNVFPIKINYRVISNSTDVYCLSNDFILTKIEQ